MSVVSIPFLLVAVVSAVLLRRPGLRAHRARLLMLAGVCFAACVMASAGDAICLAAMAATGWLAMCLVTRHKNGLLLAGAIALVVAEFLITRQILPRIAAAPWLAVGPTIGLSYVMFRVLHLIADAHGGEL